MNQGGNYQLFCRIPGRRGSHLVEIGLQFIWPRLIGLYQSNGVQGEPGSPIFALMRLVVALSPILSRTALRLNIGSVPTFGCKALLSKAINLNPKRLLRAGFILRCPTASFSHDLPKLVKSWCIRDQGKPWKA